MRSSQGYLAFRLLLAAAQKVVGSGSGTISSVGVLVPPANVSPVVMAVTAISFGRVVMGLFFALFGVQVR